MQRGEGEFRRSSTKICDDRIENKMDPKGARTAGGGGRGMGGRGGGRGRHFLTGHWRKQSSDGRGGRFSGRGAGGGGRYGRSIDINTRQFTLEPDDTGLPTRPVATFPPSATAAASAAVPPLASLLLPSQGRNMMDTGIPGGVHLNQAKPAVDQADSE